MTAFCCAISRTLALADHSSSPSSRFSDIARPQCGHLNINGRIVDARRDQVRFLVAYMSSRMPSGNTLLITCLLIAGVSFAGPWIWSWTGERWPFWSYDQNILLRSSVLPSVCAFVALAGIFHPKKTRTRAIGDYSDRLVRATLSVVSGPAPMHLTRGIAGMIHGFFVPHLNNRTSS